jgi:hypothetical protein
MASSYQSDYHDPFAVLGRHPIAETRGKTKKVAVRCLITDARTVHVQTVHPDVWLPLQPVHKGGLFSGFFPERQIPPHPRFKASFD